MSIRRTRRMNRLSPRWGQVDPYMSGLLWRGLPLTNNAALYSLYGSAGDSSYLVDGSNRISLIADRSGNSAVNVINFDGTNGTTIANITAFDGSDFTFSAWVTPQSLANFVAICGGTQGFAFGINTNGTLQSGKNNVGNNTASTGTVTAGTKYLLSYSRSGSTAVYYINNASAGSISDFQDYAGATTQIGSDAGGRILVGNISGVFIYTRALSSGEISTLYAGGVVSSTGLICSSSIGSTSKLSGTVLDSSGNSATITLPATGVWVAGARDLVQLTAAKQPAFSVVGGYNTATFDGVNDYMKAAAFSLSQPETVYFVGSQKTWTLFNSFFDGGALASALVNQNAVTPQIAWFAGSAPGVSISNLAVNTKGVIRAGFNGASSFLAANLDAGITGNPGTSTSNGFTLGAKSDASVPGNITFNEALLRSVADDTTTQLRIASYEVTKWGVVL